jgi:hypothetical protein
MSVLHPPSTVGLAWPWSFRGGSAPQVAYSVLKNDLRFNVCALHALRVSDFVGNLKTALSDMAALFPEAPPSAKL